MLEYHLKDLDSTQQIRVEKAVTNAKFIYDNAEELSKKIKEISSTIDKMLELALPKSYVQESLTNLKNTLYMANMKIRVIKEISKKNI